MTIEVKEVEASSIGPQNEVEEGAQEVFDLKRNILSCFDVNSIDLSLALPHYNNFLRSYYADKSNEVIKAVQEWAKDSKTINLVLNIGFNSHISSLLLKGEYVQAAEYILEFLEEVEDEQLQQTYLESYTLASVLLRVRPAEFTSSGCDFLYRGEGKRGKINSSREVDVTSRFFSTSRSNESAELFIRDNRDMLAIQVTKERPVLGIPVPNHLKDIGITEEIAQGRKLVYEKVGAYFGNFHSANNEIILTPNQSFTKGPRSISIGERRYRPVVVSREPLHSSEWLSIENSLRETLS